MQYCSKCVFPAIAATPLTFDKDGVCSGCRASDHKKTIDWEERRALFAELVDQYRNPDGYDCLLPVSGGKDSYFAAHVAKEFGLKALMVTYHGNNYLDEGERNLHRMKDEFGFDHIIFRPATDVLVRLNRLGLTVTGDMNWHCHAGIFTYPMQVSLNIKVHLYFGVTTALPNRVECTRTVTSSSTPLRIVTNMLCMGTTGLISKVKKG